MTTAKSADANQSSNAEKNQAFEQLAEPLRREIKLHCYRMLGSLHEAEDLVQETFVRAWHSFERFENGGSFRAWLYKIATNACLNAIASRKRARRWLPDARTPATTAMPDGQPAADVAWLEPYPDSELTNVADSAPTPDARYSADESVQLAFVAAIQYLPPRQRVVLLLCDVLGWAASEAAALLGGSTASVNSALQRARSTLAAHYREPNAPKIPPADSDKQSLLDRYLKAWEGLDVDTFVGLLKEDATYTMPPLPQWYAGRDAIRAFFHWAFQFYSDFRLLPVRANRQPAFAAYSRTKGGHQWTAHSLQVLSFQQGAISTVTLFAKPDSPRLFKAFGLPPVLGEDGP